MRIYLSFRHENDDQAGGGHDQGSGPAAPVPSDGTPAPGGEVAASGGTSGTAAVGG
jgi:hypothetical protein